MSSPNFSLADTEEFMDLADTHGSLESPAAVRAPSAESETRPSTTLPGSPSERKKTDGSIVRGAAAQWQDSSAKNPLYKKHERFYFDDGNITFLVDGILYRVHQYFLCRDSPHFAGLVKNRLDSSEGEPLKFLLEPFTLDDVNSVEFNAFLAILYPADFDRCELVTVKEWTSILRLASLWSFSSIRNLAIARLEPIASAVDKVSLGRTYGINPWLVPGFVALCLRPTALSREEGHRLRIDDTILVASLREGMRMCNFHYLPEKHVSLAVERCLALVDPWDASKVSSILIEIELDVSESARAEANTKAKAGMDAWSRTRAQEKIEQQRKSMKQKEKAAQAAAMKRAEEEASVKAKVETRMKAEMEARMKAEVEPKIREVEAKLKAELEAKMQAAMDAKMKTEAAREADLIAKVRKEDELARKARVEIMEEVEAEAEAIEKVRRARGGRK